MSTKRTLKRSKLRRARKFGWNALKRKGTKPGQIIKNKIRKGRKRLVV